MFIDTHCHLDFPEFKGEIASCLERAKQVGVKKVINVGVDVESSKRSIDLARIYPEIYATVGIHAHSALDLDLEVRPILTTYAAHKKVVAVGEVGLDYYYLKRSSQFAKYPNREEQIFCFEQMLDLALELRLPVVIHSREAEADTLAVLKSYAGSLRGVMHCFSYDYDFAKRVLDLGLLLSFTGNITYKNSILDEVIEKIPLGSMMVETDAPYLTPEPLRGKRNEPANVIQVAKKIAEIKKISLVEVEETTTKKAEKFFGMN